MKLSAALLLTARKLRGFNLMVESTATGGSTTTLIDSTFQTYADDYFNGGTVWFLSGSLADKTARITDFVGSTKTFTFGTQSAAVISGVKYAVCRATVNREALVAAVNDALQEIGPFLTSDTSLSALADTDEYTLPAGVSNVRRVELAIRTSAPYDYMTLTQWQERNGTLYFDHEQTPGPENYKIRLWYMAAHAQVDLDTDSVTDEVNPDRLAWSAAYSVLRALEGKGNNDNAKLKEAIDKAAANAAKLAAEHPNVIPQKVRYTRW